MRKFAQSAGRLTTFSVFMGLLITFGLVAVSTKELISNEHENYNAEVTKITDNHSLNFVQTGEK